MKRFRLPILFALLAFTATAPALARAADADRGAAVRAADAARFAAAVRGDTPALEGLFADDLDYCHSNGECNSKRGYIEELKSGRLKYDSIEPAIESVKLLGDVAIVIGHARVRAARNGVFRDMNIVYTDVWLWKDGRWQMTHWRSSTVSEPPPK